jgi:hypothetical protein
MAAIKSGTLTVALWRTDLFLRYQRRETLFWIWRKLIADAAAVSD